MAIILTSSRYNVLAAGAAALASDRIITDVSTWLAVLWHMDWGAAEGNNHLLSQLR